MCSFFHLLRWGGEEYSAQNHHCHLHNHLCHCCPNHHNVPFPFFHPPLNLLPFILSSTHSLALYHLSLRHYCIFGFPVVRNTALWSWLFFVHVTCMMMWHLKFIGGRNQCCYWVCSWGIEMIGSLHEVSYGKQVSYYSCKEDFCTGEQQYTADQDRRCEKARTYGAFVTRCLWSRTAVDSDTA